MIENKKQFPAPEMLERIAVALDAPALFSTQCCPSPEAGTLAQFQEEVLRDISPVIAYRIREWGQKTPQAPDPHEDKRQQWSKLPPCSLISCVKGVYPFL